MKNDIITKKQQKYILKSIQSIIFQYKELQEKCPEFITVKKEKRLRTTGIYLFTKSCPLQSYIHVFSSGLKTNPKGSQQYDNNYVFVRRQFWNKLAKHLDAYFPATFESLRELVEIIDENVFKIYGSNLKKDSK